MHHIVQVVTVKDCLAMSIIQQSQYEACMSQAEPCMATCRWSRSRTTWPEGPRLLASTDQHNITQQAQTCAEPPECRSSR